MLSDHEPEQPAGQGEPVPLTCSKGNEEVAEIGKLLLTLAGRSLTPPERTATGYRLRLPPDADVERTVREFVRRDKECCPFLEFSVKRGPEALELDVRGPEAASQLLDRCVEFASLSDRGSKGRHAVSSLQPPDEPAGFRGKRAAAAKLRAP